MKKIHAKNMGASKVTFTNTQKELINGFKIDLLTEKTETYILLTKEELMPIIKEIIGDSAPEGFYI